MGPILAFDNAKYPSLRYLRQQALNAVRYASLRRVHDPWPNRTRFPELDQEAVKIQPLPENSFSNGLLDIDQKPREEQVARYANREVSKIPMRGCDGLERQDDPFDAP